VVLEALLMDLVCVVREWVVVLWVMGDVSDDGDDGDGGCEG
jgi:hypothetical protein